MYWPLVQVRPRERGCQPPPDGGAGGAGFAGGVAWRGGAGENDRGGAGGRYLQTTAAISPGSSGGGLFDAHGNLLGITAFTMSNSQSLNFAIPAEDFWQ